MNWIIISGCIPPDFGGIAGYTQRVAEGLHEAGHGVWVFAGPAHPGAAQSPQPFQLRRLVDHFKKAGLAEMDAEIAKIPEPRRILVQYVPQPLGPRPDSRLKGIPFSLVRWLSRQRFAAVTTMVHESGFASTSLHPRFLVFKSICWLMLSMMTRASNRIFLSCEAWIQQIPHGRLAKWLPVPSNLPVESSPERIAAIRSKYCLNGCAEFVGHLGTYPAELWPVLSESFALVLRGSDRIHALFMGQGSRVFHEMFSQQHPDLLGRAQFLDDLPDQHLSDLMAACDLLLIPYPDGLSTRRSSTMVALALGVPVVTNDGPATEALWRSEQAVELLPTDDPAQLSKATLALLADKARLSQLSVNGRALYQKRFSLATTLAAFTA